MTIISSLPSQIVNNTLCDADQVSADFTSIMTQVNANAVGLNQPNAFSVQPTGVLGTQLASMPIVSQIQNNSLSHATSNTGTVDAIVGVYAPTPVSLVDGAVFSINITSPNLTTTPTFNCGAGGDIGIVKANGTAVLAGDIFGTVKFQYNSALLKYVLLNPFYGVGVPAAIQNSTHNHCTAPSGGVDAILAAYTPVPAALVDGLELSVDIASPNTLSNPTFNCGVGGNVTVIKNYGDALIPGDLHGVAKLKYIAALSKWCLLNPSVASLPQIQTVGASANANALTVTIAPNTLDFRDTTLTSGVITRVINPSTLSLTVPQLATLGTPLANQPVRLVIVELNNAGTPAIGIINSPSSLDESGVISTTMISALANSLNVVYSAAALTNVAYRVVGFVDISQATPGIWLSPPIKVQGVGGEAMTAMSGLGYNQTWQDFTGIRGNGVTYYNTTGKPIFVNVKSASSGATGSSVSASVNGNAAGDQSVQQINCEAAIGFPVPPGNSYSATASYGPGWKELR